MKFMNIAKKYYRKAAVTSMVSGGMLIANIASAAPSSFTTPTKMDADGTLYTYGGVILTGLGALWLFRKLVKTTNRS